MKIIVLFLFFFRFFLYIRIVPMKSILVILRWVITFTVCLLIYDLTGSFWMSLGILILLIVAENLIVDWWKKRKGGRA